MRVWNNKGESNITATYGAISLLRSKNTTPSLARHITKTFLPPDNTHKGVTRYTLQGKVCKKEYRQKYPYSFCFSAGITPTCHLEQSPPEIPPSLCSVLLRSSTTLRFAQNDTGGRSRNPKGERQCRSDLAGRLKPALSQVALWLFFLWSLTYFLQKTRSRKYCRCAEIWVRRETAERCKFSYSLPHSRF